MPQAATTPRVPTESDVRTARKWAAIYRDRGYNPLPSRPDEKRPFIRYSQYWEEPFPAEDYARFRTGNVQVMTGRHWGLVVVDLDGPEAIEHWEANSANVPRTWVTHSGDRGRHLWFRVPTQGPPIPSGRVWGLWDADANDGKGDWRKHVAVEIIGDRKLIMAPPSIHPKTGRRYRFVGGRSPVQIARPATLPRWIEQLPRLTSPRLSPGGAAGAGGANEWLRKVLSVPFTGRYDTRAVLDAIPDKVAMAEACGLRFASKAPNASGWCSCHAIGREDRSPSASFHPESGVYWEANEPTLRFFDLLAALGAYPDWRDAVGSVGTTLGVRPIDESC